MLKKALKWGVIIIIAAYVLLVIGRAIYFGFERRTDAQVAKIHATKLTLDDVMGKNLPPDPGEAADDTIEGVDANKNGIRDDVELAIFKEYPNSAKTRAVLLQYALALQMEVTQEVVNKKTVTVVAQQTDKAYICVGELTLRSNPDFFNISEKLHNFIKTRHLNTEARRLAQKDFYSGNLDSYSSLEEICDIDLSTLPN